VGSISDIASAKSGAVSTALQRSRCVMSASSGFAGSSAVIALGSRAIPHSGQGPGASRTTSGCIGHVHSVPGIGAGSGGRSLAGFRYRSGSASNFFLQPAAQK
jgi:hypothetical protein